MTKSKDLHVDTVADAIALAKRLDRMVYVRVDSANGRIIQAYPGGRTILWPELPRYIGRLEKE